jgi:DNA-directed RNA polymerase subunit RPC12/RpoP
MTYLEHYKCSTCKHVWFHLWDTEDFNNDYTLCPRCLSLDFYEISADAYLEDKSPAG